MKGIESAEWIFNLHYLSHALGSQYQCVEQILQTTGVYLADALSCVFIDLLTCHKVLIQAEQDIFSHCIAFILVHIKEV
jgi:hypothetical protein